VVDDEGVIDDEVEAEDVVAAVTWPSFDDEDDVEDAVPLRRERAAFLPFLPS
jgi:hypothetical protein